MVLAGMVLEREFLLSAIVYLNKIAGYRRKS